MRRPDRKLRRSPREEDRDGSAAKATDAAVRRALVESRQDLLSFLRRRLGNREEAEDVLQRFSLRALERASDLRDIRTVRGWLGRILANTIVDHQRRAMRSRRREVAMEQTDIESLAVEPDVELAIASTSCSRRSTRIMRRSSGAPRAPRRHHAEQRDSFGFIEVAKRSRNGSRKCV